MSRPKVAHSNRGVTRAGGARRWGGRGRASAGVRRGPTARPPPRPRPTRRSGRRATPSSRSPSAIPPDFAIPRRSGGVGVRPARRSLADLERIVAENGIEVVLVAGGEFDEAELLDRVRSPECAGCDLLIVSRLPAFVTQTGTGDHIGSVPIMRIRTPPLDGVSWSLKRIRRRGQRRDAAAPRPGHGPDRPRGVARGWCWRDLPAGARRPRRPPVRVREVPVDATDERGGVGDAVVGRRRRARRPRRAAAAPHVAGRAAAAVEHPAGRYAPRRAAPERPHFVEKFSPSCPATASVTAFLQASQVSLRSAACAAPTLRSPTAPGSTTTTSRTGRSGSTPRFCSARSPRSSSPAVVESGGTKVSLERRPGRAPARRGR